MHFSKFTPRSLPRCRVGQLRAHRNQIANYRLEDSGRGFNRDMRAALLEPIGEFFELRRKQRLAAGDDHMAGWILGNFAENFFQAPCFALRLPRGVGRVTPNTTEVATAGPDKYGRRTEQPAFALYRIKYLADAHGTNLTGPPPS